MKCGMCHKEIPEDLPEPEESCGACPGGCRKVHCPYCGYANPVMPGFLKGLFKSQSKKDQGDKS